MHVFTSITANYLPKARVLARSVKKRNPEARFHVVLCDVLPTPLAIEEEPFDSVITIDELPIPEKKSWIFKHTVVELCTAVKGVAFLEIVCRFQAEQIFYFDPDIVVFSGLDGLTQQLGQCSILLTPHQTRPEPSLETIADHEIASLKHGVFNLGFLGVRTTAEGLCFLEWWSHRLLNFCYDDIARGLFTDQRWADLIPAFFDDIKILREPIYNVATWNLTHRAAAGSLEAGITINGEPLSFYHFSGFDSGAQAVMLEKYGQDSPVLTDLREWYVAECQRMGQQDLGQRRCCFEDFDNGKPITKSHRLVYRVREDLQQVFPNPFLTSPQQHSYYHWYKDNVDPMPPSTASDASGASKWALVEDLRAEQHALQQAVHRLHETLAQRDHSLNHAEQLLDEARRALALRETALSEAQQYVREREADIAQLKMQITELESQLGLIYASRSWRYTRIFRQS